ncbi:MAG: sulfotransferase family 2 domain-containing protein [Cyanobacteria bacterium J06623_7]
MQQCSNSLTANTTVIFLHLPKAAGTTLKDILHRQYRQNEIYELNHTQFIQAQAEFAQLSHIEKAKIKLLMGHMYFGLHEFTTAPVTYITMLRNPIDRAISYYHFVKNLTGHQDSELIRSKNISLKEYCQMQRENMCNGQTRFLSGTREFESCSFHQLELAKQNLQKYFALVGIQERFDESLLLLRAKLNWKKSPFYYRRNTNRTKSYAQLGISTDTLATIEKYNALDLELYEYAYKMFARELAQHEQNQQKLRLFKLSNQLYGRYSMFAQKLIFQ